MHVLRLQHSSGVHNCCVRREERAAIVLFSSSVGSNISALQVLTSLLPKGTSAFLAHMHCLLPSFPPLVWGPKTDQHCFLWVTCKVEKAFGPLSMGERWPMGDRKWSCVITVSHQEQQIWCHWTHCRLWTHAHSISCPPIRLTFVFYHAHFDFPCLSFLP